jgi:hypothetical protein
MTDQERLELEAAAFRRLVAHLDSRKDVQNIDLMNLSGFCRNCLSKWYKAAAEERSRLRHAVRRVESPIPARSQRRTTSGVRQRKTQ